AVYLNLRAEPYLATLLAGADALVDLKGFEQERSARLRKLLGNASWRAESVGELAAMTWLSESLTRQSLLDRFADPIVPLDFEEVLSNLEQSLERVLRHLDVEAPPGFSAAAVRGPVLRRYSKAPNENAYSPATRAELLAQARREHAQEIRKGLQFLEHL